MYAGVDVGGTKTLVAVLDNKGTIVESRKFPTPHNYQHFLLELRHTLAHMKNKDFRAVGAGIPTSRFDRLRERAYTFGNLPWRNVPIQGDLERIFGCPVVVENDAKMACISETALLKGKYDRVMYVTISTGIGYALTVNGKLDVNVGDVGGRGIILEHDGKLMSWEDFASGHAIVERYGKKAQDITDESTWKAIVYDLTLGFLQLVATCQPEVIVIGGSVGVYFERYGNLLEASLKVYETPVLSVPVLKKAGRPEEAVIYGCYELARECFHAEIA